MLQEYLSSKLAPHQYLLLVHLEEEAFFLGLFFLKILFLYLDLTYHKYQYNSNHDLVFAHKDHIDRIQLKNNIL